MAVSFRNGLAMLKGFRRLALVVACMGCLTAAAQDVAVEPLPPAQPQGPVILDMPYAEGPWCPDGS